MSWAQRLKRVFKLDLTSCEGCGGQVRVIACLEDPVVIAKILSHREGLDLPLPGAPKRDPWRVGTLHKSRYSTHRKRGIFGDNATSPESI
jgi:hypothetical protein